MFRARFWFIVVSAGAIFWCSTKGFTMFYNIEQHSSPLLCMEQTIKMFERIVVCHLVAFWTLDIFLC